MNGDGATLISSTNAPGAIVPEDIRLLVPVDFSQSSRQALQWAVVRR